MFEIDDSNVVRYLHDRGWLNSRVKARADLLAWGVSNVVLRVTPETGEPLVIKQSRGQLRTKDPWFSRLDRIWREVDVMRCIEPLLPPGIIPRIMFEDRENYLFGMEAVVANHIVWKQVLLEGRADRAIASRLGTYLGTIHRRTACNPELRSRFGNTEVFVQLRVDPFYRRVADASPSAAPHIDRLIAEMFSQPICLVHADFSPKNVLVAGERVVLVDFETGHYGDPAFDLGFFLSHLLLKSIRHFERYIEYAAMTVAFWETYLKEIAELHGQSAFAPPEIAQRTMGHLAGCMWARIDGTSKIDYLQESQRHLVREFCQGLFADRPADWNGVLQRLKSRFDS
jgi:5-methylthioribose kinase